MTANIFGLSSAGLADALAPFALPPYRAGQIAAWMHRRGATSFDEMSDLPKPLRAELAGRLAISRGTCARELRSADGDTRKALLEFDDGEAVETVLMRHDYGASVCVSSQAGCAMGCAFCASTARGLARDLSAPEMLAQVVHWSALLARDGGRVGNVVVMGSGEPLLNYGSLVAFARLLREQLGLGLRRVTVSTSGIVPGIDRLAREGLPVTLSVSLHAPTDELRTRLMPVNRRYPLAAVLAAARRYAQSTGRRVTYEYLLIAGVNDSDWHARALGRLLRGQLAGVNLIPLNPTDRQPDWHRPAAERVARFAAALGRQVSSVTVRREMGADISAACGQLRNSRPR